MAGTTPTPTPTPAVTTTAPAARDPNVIYDANGNGIASRVQPLPTTPPATPTPQGSTAAGATPTPPAGGFQVGGWYNGMQWNGTSFGKPGVVNMPGQPGYNQPVSDEVNQQSSIAQGKAPNAIHDYLYGPSTTGTTGANGAGTTTPVTDQMAALDKQISDRAAAHDQAIKNVNDNPFYSEARRVGEQAKIDSEYNNDINTLTLQKNQLQAQNTAAQANVQIIQGNDVVAAIDKTTGKILYQTNIPGLTKASTTTASTKMTADQINQTVSNAGAAVKAGATLQQLKEHYGIAGGLTDDQIYAIYNSNSKTPADVTLAQFKQGIYTKPNANPFGTTTPTPTPTAGLQSSSTVRPNSNVA